MVHGAFSPVIEIGASRAAVGNIPELQWVYEGQTGQPWFREEDPRLILLATVTLSSGLVVPTSHRRHTPPPALADTTAHEEGTSH